MAITNNGPQTSKMVLYDAANSTVTINGKVYFGFKGGSAIFEVTWDNDRATIDTDAFGTSTVSRVHKNSATVTVNLNETSPCNKALAELCDANAVFPVDLINEVDHVWGDECVVTKLGNVAAEEQAGNRAWTIHILNANYEFVGKAE